ncbi:MAG: hypothetical protein N2Z58_09275 [Fervidobacterium sp.]|nr:hypothetical protein [Fervidobacterium sp.]
MDLSLSGLIAAMIVFTIIFAMLGLIFDITLRVLNQQKLYSEFSAEAQRIVHVVDLLLSQSVWTDRVSANGSSLTLDFFVPVGTSVVKQLKMLRIENSEIVFDGKRIASISNLVRSVRFSLEDIRGKKYILMSIEPESIRFRPYLIPIMTALSEGN